MPSNLICRDRAAERGGVTILIALTLLGLLTLIAMSASRNSMREVLIAGTMRQGAMARNAADSGIEWSIHWLHDENDASANDSAKKLRALKLALLQDGSKAGIARNVLTSSPANPEVYDKDSSDSPADLTLTPIPNHKQYFTLGLTSMGKLPITDSSQGVSDGTYKPAAGGVPKQAPDLWAVRSDGKVVVGGVTFRHGKEAWISTPVQK